MAENTTDTLTLEQVADTLGIHPRFVERFADSGALDTIETDGVRVTTSEAVAEFSLRRAAAAAFVDQAIAGDVAGAPPALGAALSPGTRAPGRCWGRPAD